MPDFVPTQMAPALRERQPTLLRELLGASESTATRIINYEVGRQFSGRGLLHSTATLTTFAQPGPIQPGTPVLMRAPATSHQQQSYDRRAAFKVATSLYAMHLGDAWRAGLFTSLDRLLDEEEWDFSEKMPADSSWLTFLRMIINLGTVRRPALGATADGKIVAAWLNGKDRLTIECGDADSVRWSLVRWNPDREAAAGITKAGRLPKVLEAYDPKRWFEFAVD